MRQSNRALRATIIVIFAWVGLRSWVLITSSPTDVAVARADTPIRNMPLFSSAPMIANVPPQQTKPRSFVSYPRQTPQLSKAVNYVFQAATSEAPLIMDSIAPLPMSAAIKTETATVQPKPTEDSPNPPNRRRDFDPVISAYSIIRPASSGQALATNGQLGASQIGIRIQQPVAYIGARQVASLNVRVSAPIDQRPGREAGIGVAIRRSAVVPFELIAERRVALGEGGRNAFAVIAVSGFDDLRVAPGLSLSGYAQAGMVGFRQRDGFADGAARVERTLFDRKRTAVRIGTGIWGAAQPGVTRLDIGPLAALKQKVGSSNIRISAEYRWRISGQARPASGPALSIGADF